MALWGHTNMQVFINKTEKELPESISLQKKGYLNKKNHLYLFTAWNVL